LKIYAGIDYITLVLVLYELSNQVVNLLGTKLFSESRFFHLGKSNILEARERIIGFQASFLFTFHEEHFVRIIIFHLCFEVFHFL